MERAHSRLLSQSVSRSFRVSRKYSWHNLRANARVFPNSVRTESPKAALSARPFRSIGIVLADKRPDGSTGREDWGQWSEADDQNPAALDRSRSPASGASV